MLRKSIQSKVIRLILIKLIFSFKCKALKIKFIELERRKLQEQKKVYGTEIAAIFPSQVRNKYETNIKTNFKQSYLCLTIQALLHEDGSGYI
jgi:hypothetical protein